MPDLKALLDQIDRLDQETTKGPWENIGRTIESNGTYEDVITTEVDCSSYCYGGKGGGVLKDKDAEFIALARTVLPAMNKALRDIMEIHKPSELYPAVTPGVIYCYSCWDGVTDEAYIYPCPTAQTIHDTLGD